MLSIPIHILSIEGLMSTLEELDNQAKILLVLDLSFPEVLSGSPETDCGDCLTTA